jgi:hypothetical protein
VNAHRGHPDLSSLGPFTVQRPNHHMPCNSKSPG